MPTVLPWPTLSSFSLEYKKKVFKKIFTNTCRLTDVSLCVGDDPKTDGPGKDDSAEVFAVLREPPWPAGEADSTVELHNVLYD